MDRYDVVYFYRLAQERLAGLPRWAWLRRSHVEREIRVYSRQLFILGGQK